MGTASNQLATHPMLNRQQTWAKACPLRKTTVNKQKSKMTKEKPQRVEDPIYGHNRHPPRKTGSHRDAAPKGQEEMFRKKKY